LLFLIRLTQKKYLIFFQLYWC